MPEVTTRASKAKAKPGAAVGMPRARTASREVRRRQLIEATIESISRYGISGTTMTTVTGFAGLSNGIVNFHFKNKKTLFEETLRHLAEEHRALWRQSVEQADLAPAAKLLAIVDSEFHPQVASRRKLTVWFGFYGEAGYRETYRRLMAEIDEERWRVSTALLAEIIADGEYSDVVAENVAATLEGLYDGFCANILIYPGEFTAEDAKLRVREYLATVFPDHFERPRQRRACEG